MKCILLELHEQYIECCKAENNIFKPFSVELRPEWEKDVASIIKEEKADIAGYFLQHTGDSVNETMSMIEPGFLEDMIHEMRYKPFNVNSQLKNVIRLTGKLPALKHVLFSDTAFFNKMPLKSSNYAIPPELRDKGLKRYGGYGLCHLNALQSSRKALNKKAGNVISIYLGDQTNICAILDQTPVETTFGFTSIEGIPSATGSGDIDPTIVFELHGKGLSFRDINRILCSESGLTGLYGKRIGFYDLLDKSGEANADQVIEILKYSILKYAGAFVSILGGADTIVFCAEKPEKCGKFILDICSDLEFLGLKCEQRPGAFKISTEDSGLPCCIIKYNKWEIMYNMIAGNIR